MRASDASCRKELRSSGRPEAFKLHACGGHRTSLAQPEEARDLRVFDTSSRNLFRKGIAMEMRSRDGDFRGGRSSDDQVKPQTERKHPAEWEEDLNPDHMAGQNIGERSADREQGVPTAYDVREVHRALSDFRDDELKQIPLVPEGARLRQGATYLDLGSGPPGEEFTAMGDMEATEGSRYIAKDQVPYEIWNRLRGVNDPERTLREDARGG